MKASRRLVGALVWLCSAQTSAQDSSPPPSASPSTADLAALRREQERSFRESCRPSATPKRSAADCLSADSPLTQAERRAVLDGVLSGPHAGGALSELFARLVLDDDPYLREKAAEALGLSDALRSTLPTRASLDRQWASLMSNPKLPPWRPRPSKEELISRCRFVTDVRPFLPARPKELAKAKDPGPHGVPHPPLTFLRSGKPPKGSGIQCESARRRCTPTRHSFVLQAKPGGEWEVVASAVFLDRMDPGCDY